MKELFERLKKQGASTKKNDQSSREKQSQERKNIWTAPHHPTDKQKDSIPSQTLEKTLEKEAIQHLKEYSNKCPEEYSNQCPKKHPKQQPRSTRYKHLKKQHDTQPTCEQWRNVKSMKKKSRWISALRKQNAKENELN